MRAHGKVFPKNKQSPEQTERARVAKIFLLLSNVRLYQVYMTLHFSNDEPCITRRAARSIARAINMIATYVLCTVQTRFE